MAKHFELKVPGARKTEQFILYPMAAADTIAKLQSDNRCIVVNTTSGRMHVSKRVAQYPRFESCKPQYGGKMHDAPADLLKWIEETRTNSETVRLV